MTPADKAAGNALPLLERAWEHAWNGQARLPWSLTAEERNALGYFLPKLYQGAATWSDVHAAAPIVAKAFSPPDALVRADPGSVEVEITATDDERVLSDIPWEVAATLSLPDIGAPLLEYLAGRHALVRVVADGSAFDATASSRPSVLWCVSSPAGVGDEIDLVAFNNILQQTFDFYPHLHAESLPQILGGSSRPFWSDASEHIERRKPTIFVLVAHGESGGHDGPAVYFQSPTDQSSFEAISISRLAAALRKGRCWLAVLICCDLVRATAYSAALQLIRSGVPQVVAMQGKINHETAKEFLDHFLASLLARHSTPIATAIGRTAAGNSAHACLPVAFSSASERGRASPLAGVATRYEAAHLKLAAYAAATLPYLERTALENGLLELLNSRSALVVTSALGDGATELVKACARRATLPEYRRASRPVIYIDLHRLARSVTQELSSILQQVSSLLLGEVDPSNGSTATDLLRLIEQARVTVVIDHVPAVAAELPPTDFWRTLIAEANAPGRNGGVCLLPAQLDPETFAGDSARTIERFEVPPLDSRETAEYVLANMPGADADLLFAATGGKPSFLDAARQRWLKKPGSDTIDEMAKREGRDTAERLLDLLWPILSGKQRQVMFEMACLRGAAMSDAVIQHIVGAEAENALDQLVQRGLVRSFSIEAAATDIWMPVWFREAIHRQRHTVATRNARARIAARFKALDRDAQKAAAQGLAVGRGGAAIFECLAQSLLDSGDLHTAYDLAVFAEAGGVEDLVILQLYEKLITFMKQRTKGHRAHPDMVLRAIARAQNLGRNDRVRELFEELEREGKPYQRADTLTKKAIWLKDTQQSDALPKIDALVMEALALTASPHDADGPAPADWAALRENILLNSLQAHLFLAGETYATVPEEYRALITSLPDTPNKAVLLCTFAEKEMRRPAEAVNWTNVVEWVTAADAMLSGSIDNRAITYCAYQYAQYIRHHVAGREHDAYALFKRADKAGELSGEVRRWGLARAARVEMLLADHALEQELGDVRAHVPALLDEVLEKMPARPNDAFTARVLGRLHVLRAAVAANEEEEHHHHDRAAALFSEPILHSERDKKWFVTEAIHLLGKALDDRIRGDFRYAQQFVRRFRGRLASLGVSADIEAPDKVLGSLRSLPLTE